MGYEQIGDYFFANIVKKFQLNNEKIINVYEYIKRNETLQKDISSFLLELINGMALFNKQKSIDYLLELYVDKNSNKISEYIVGTDQKELYRFFDENDGFRADLIKTYINALTQRDYALESAKEKARKEEASKKEPTEEIVSVQMLPDLLRESFMLVYNMLTSHGMPETTFGEMMANIFKSGGMIRTDSEKFSLAMRFLLENRELFIRIMYADIFIVIGKINHDKKYDEIIDYILEAHNLNEYELPESLDFTAEMFAFMANINDDMQIRSDIVQNASSEDLKIYKEINPLSLIEDIKYRRG